MPALPRPRTSPRLARSSRLRAVAPAIVATVVAASAAPAAASGGGHLTARERAVIHRVNLIRRAHGLQALVASGRLSRAADRHSATQLRDRTLGHQLPGESSVEGRLAFAARSRPVGETVLWSSRGASSRLIVRAWMHSPEHRAVLLSPEFGRAGIGIRSGAGGVYATADLTTR